MLINHIMEADLTNEEIRELWATLKIKSGIRRQIAVAQLSVGDYVKFTSRKGHGEVYGVIKKLNQKTVSLLASNGVLWRVTPDILEPSTEEEHALAPTSESRVPQFGRFA